MSPSGAIGLGEFTEIFKDEEIGTGIFFIYASTYFPNFPPPCAGESRGVALNQPEALQGELGFH